MSHARQALFVRPSLSVSGADRWAVDAALALQARGWDVKIAVNTHNPGWTAPEVASGQVRVSVWGGMPLWCTANRLRVVASLVNQKILIQRIRRRRELAPDLMVGDIVPQALPAMRQAFRDSALLYYCHFPDRLGVTARGLYGRYREAVGRLEDRGMRRADRVVANSHYTSEALRRTFPFLPDERLAIVQPGVRLAEPAGAGGAVEQGAKRVLLSVARFDPRKGSDLAIEAFAGLRARLTPAEFVSWRLVLAGGFDRRLPEVRALVTRLQNQAAALGIGAQVEFRFDPSDEALRVLWGEAYAFIHPAPAEHFGIVLIEAMAHRLPVLAVNHGGPREIVVDGLTGALREPVPAAFAEVLGRWVQAPELAAELGAAGRRRVEEEFAMEKFAARFAAQAEEALAAERAAP